MKKIIAFSKPLLIAICLITVLYGCSYKQSEKCIFIQDDFIRIHIKASSNQDFDQTVKLRVRDSVIVFLQEKLKSVQTKEQALEVINNNLDELTKLCDLTLSHCGASYKTNIALSRESFPERIYGEKIFPEGVYDSLIIKLNNGEGENWWCVAYPPLCFICGTENPDAPKEIKYESLLFKWINDLLNK